MYSKNVPLASLFLWKLLHHSTGKTLTLSRPFSSSTALAAEKGRSLFGWDPRYVVLTKDTLNFSMTEDGPIREQIDLINIAVLSFTG